MLAVAVPIVPVSAGNGGSCTGTSEFLKCLHHFPITLWHLRARLRTWSVGLACHDDSLSIDSDGCLTKSAVEIILYNFPQYKKT